MREIFCSFNLEFYWNVCLFLVSAGQQPIFQRVSAANVMPGAVHRPQVQQISNNIVTLTNVQSPAMYSAQSKQMQPNRSNSQPLQTLSMPVKADTNNKGNGLALLYHTFRTDTWQ